MTEYRKYGTRLFYRIEDNVVTRVVNMYGESEVKISKGNGMHISDAKEETKVISEAEFNEQLELANDRIKSQKIV